MLRRRLMLIGVLVAVMPLVTGCPGLSGGTSTIGNFSGFLGTLFIDPDGTCDDSDGQIEFTRAANGRLLLRGLADNPDIEMIVAVGGDTATASGVRQFGRTDVNLTLTIVRDGKMTLSTINGAGATGTSVAYGPISPGNSACQYSTGLISDCGIFPASQLCLTCTTPCRQSGRYTVLLEGNPVKKCTVDLTLSASTCGTCAGKRIVIVE